MDKKFKLLASNTLIFAIGSFGSKFIMFFFLPIYTNVLSAEEYGVAELITTFSSLVVPFMSFSIGDAVLRFGLDKKNKPEAVIKNALLINTCGSVMLLLFIPILSFYAPIQNYVGYLVLLSITTAFKNALQYYTKATGNNLFFALDSIINTLVLAIANVVLLVILDGGITEYLWAQILSVLVSVIFLLVVNRVPRMVMKEKTDKELLKQMMKYSAPMILNAVSWWIIHSTDKVMLQHYMSSVEVGVYGVASKIPTLINSVTYFFTQAWIISAITEYDTERDEKFYEKAFQGFNFMLCLVVSGVLLVLKPFMLIYVGEDFTEAWRFIPLLLIATIFRNYSDFFGAFFSSAKKNISVMLTTFTGAMCNVVLNAVLIPVVGVQGAVIGTAGSFMAVGLYRMLASRRIMAFNIKKGITILSVVIVTVQAIFVILNQYVVLVSMLALIIIILLNREIFKMMVQSLFSMLRSKLPNKGR